MGREKLMLVIWLTGVCFVVYIGMVLSDDPEAEIMFQELFDG